MKRVYLILSGLLVLISAFSAKVNREVASDVAMKYMTGKFGSNFQVERIYEITNENSATQYVINLAPEGWIVIAADDRVKPVLAYSDEGTFNLSDNLSPEVKYWMNEYKGQITSVIRDNSKPKNAEWDKLQHDGYSTTRLKSVQTAVSPILDIKWDQGSGWNALCPKDDEGPGGHAYVGCVAVAMAQAMYSVKLDAPLAGEHRYTHDKYGSIYLNYATKDPFDWDAMSKTSANAENQRLLYYCAVAVSMDFGPDGSGSYSNRIVSALKEHFGYSGDVKYYERFDDDNEWKDLIKSELDKGHVLVYAGDPGTGEAGHCFNIDGYDINDYFHFNWGWSGRYNGYYSIENINPGTYKFNVNQDLIVGIAETYYGPTDITLSSSEVDEGLPVGSFVGKVTVKDNSSIDLFTYTLDGGPKFPSGVKEAAFYIENDSLKTKQEFDASVKNEYILNIHVKDLQQYTYSKEFIIKVLPASNTATPIQKIPSDDVNVYYSSVLKSIVVENQDNTGHVKLDIFDLNGKMIRSEEITGRGTVDVGSGSRGLYILKIASDNGKPLFKKILIN
ncbi:thiol protease/hemagglutinin PrtT [Saccharicrinis sp. FJH54]|uniref:thiol protease/hemagglutinin PrtT n=1 Tax=Saccharicrinis sp. FJH54 TaxID=3344665 RepID=UPI0035D4C87D